MAELPSKTMFTVKEAAKLCGKTTGRIRQICIKRKLGTEVNSRMRLLSKADIGYLSAYFNESGRDFQKAACSN